MNKLLLQGLLSALFFFTACFLLQQIDWMSLFKVEELTGKTEQKLGEMYWEFFKQQDQEINDQSVTNAIDSLVTTICDNNYIEKSRIKFHVLNNDEMNAFALPGGRLVIYSGLISAVENQEELSGVISHEIAHIELNHVMKKLIKEVGLSVLISMTTGDSGIGTIKETAKMLSSTAFDRGWEREADIKAVEYLIQAHIDPQPFSNFLSRLAENENELMEYLSWMNTHPASQERARYIIEHAENESIHNQPVLSLETWDNVKAAVESI
jgi:predicted Zn-dependent protease